MLSILGQRPAAFCDGHSRRHFLKIGGLALGGLSLPQVLRAEAASAARPKSHKAIIMIYLSGGPSHQDMLDLKMDAPREIRGSFRPTQTNVPGIEICEHMPRLAKMMDSLPSSARCMAAPISTPPTCASAAIPLVPRGGKTTIHRSAQPCRSCKGWSIARCRRLSV